MFKILSQVVATAMMQVAEIVKVYSRSSKPSNKLKLKLKFMKKIKIYKKTKVLTPLIK